MMNRIRFKRIALVLVGVVLLCQAGRILEFITALDLGSMLTLDPLRHASEGVRCLITIALCVLVFVVLSSLFQRRK